MSGDKCPGGNVRSPPWRQRYAKHTAGTGSALAEFKEQWCDVIRPSRGENQPSGGVDDGLKPVDEVTGNAGRLRIAVVNLFDLWSTNYDQQGVTKQETSYAADLPQRCTAQDLTVAVI